MLCPNYNDFILCHWKRKLRNRIERDKGDEKLTFRNEKISR